MPGQYRLHVSFADKLDHPPNRQGALAAVSLEHPYRNIYVELDKEWVDRANGDEIQDTMIHEILHVLLFSPMERFLDKRLPKLGKREQEEYSDLQEELIELTTLWLCRFRDKFGQKVWG